MWSSASSKNQGVEFSLSQALQKKEWVTIRCEQTCVDSKASQLYGQTLESFYSPGNMITDASNNKYFKGGVVFTKKTDFLSLTLIYLSPLSLLEINQTVSEIN